ncbi:hypothetical protein DRJ19_05610, partial [Candidatus Woesearchaeota archaeon]
MKLIDTSIYKGNGSRNSDTLNGDEKRFYQRRGFDKRYRILQVLAVRGMVSSTDLRKILGVRRQTLWYYLGELEERGLVKVSRSRLGSMVRITDVGMMVYKRCQNYRRNLAVTRQKISRRNAKHGVGKGVGFRLYNVFN